MKVYTFGLQALFMLFLYSACNQASDPAQAVVDAAITSHGGDKLENATLAFDFRERHYTYARTGGTYAYTRAFTDSTGAKVTDVLRNDRFTRTVNGNTVQLPEERQKAFSNSVNSVLYFALLPYGLNDAAVQKEWIGKTELEGKSYDLVKVTFRQEGGGEDFEDEFLYWFNTETHTLDYLAYNYQTEGGGVRFRKAINPRQVEGILFQDYINYKPASKDVPLEALEELYKKDSLEVLSNIELENIAVDLGHQ